VTTPLIDSAGARASAESTFTLLFLFCACALVGSHGLSVTALTGRVSSPQPISRTVRVTVITNKGETVPDLTPADFELKEDGKTREVLKIEPIAEPLSVAVLLDDRGSDINEIRSALAAFVVRIQGRAEVSLVSVVPTVVKVFDYTSSVPTMMAGIQRLVWRAGPAGGLVLSAVADAADELARREAEHPAIVAVTFEGEEFRSHRPANVILASLERSRAPLHVVSVGAPTIRKLNRAAVESGNAQGDDWTVDQTNRNAVLGDGPKQSGGRRHELAVASGLTRALEAVADDLLNQYAVVYAGASDAKPSRKMNVSVKRRGVTVLAPAKITGG
jgi:VWFA-related protein